MLKSTTNHDFRPPGRKDILKKFRLRLMDDIATIEVAEQSARLVTQLIFGALGPWLRAMRLPTAESSLSQGPMDCYVSSTGSDLRFETTSVRPRMRASLRSTLASDYT